MQRGITEYATDLRIVLGINGVVRFEFLADS
jgi:hypothetical protein